ncbi:hypothetical protein [Knoellia koreensis]|uniref:Lipoprotein n=1 Tax=Knoellia koreensis TaxID=2730921 RepID=A0A849HFT7_9MICO|nr:hypothetical protein [Knoellia sp. DB2414S]NNM45513.1 hypothetical protein [Knoellia sp. DB2414S]
MKRTHTNRLPAFAVAVAAAISLGAGCAAAHASTRGEGTTTRGLHRSWHDAEGSTGSILYGSTLFATWGTVTNGTSSANAAEHRSELTGGHAGSSNAAEAPAYSSAR